MAKAAEVVEEVVEEVVDVTDAPEVVKVDHSLLDTRKEDNTTSDWVDPATVESTVKTSYDEAMEALRSGE